MFGIDDAILGSVAGSVVGGLFGGDSGGGSQTVSKEPWAAAAPWLKQQIQTGQDLQGYYQNNPFNALQQQAYGQLFGQNNYLQNAIPGLLAQFSQSQGFDRSNPMARPAAIQFPSAQGLLTGGGVGSGGTGIGLLGDMNTAFNPFKNGGITAPAPAPAAPPASTRPANDSAGAYFQLPNGNWQLGYDRETYGAT
jgi:hypothetical protein